MLSDDPFARERRLRRLATKRGFVLVSPWAGERGVVLVAWAPATSLSLKIAG